MENHELHINELNIYTDFNYKRMIKRANLYFTKRYLWYCPKKIFAPQYGNYTISFYKRNIRICCWENNSDIEQYKKTKDFIRFFIENNLKSNVVGITFNQNCNILDLVSNIKTIHIQ